MVCVASPRPVELSSPRCPASRKDPGQSDSAFPLGFRLMAFPQCAQRGALLGPQGFDDRGKLILGSEELRGGDLRGVEPE